jgi:hypothetical protein
MSGPQRPAGDLSFVVHAHLYQPPREDPWLGSIPAEVSASPYHDWNERIHDECYRPLTQARLLDDEGRIRGFINTLEWISFDAAPTLLRWMERDAPRTYEAILEADRRSVERLGHGNAVATPYHHSILPLASPRDRRTEIRWGLADFRSRFGRDPEGFWLPEAAVDLDTLRDLQAEGIRFTIVGSDQVDGEAPADGRAGSVDLGGGRSIAVFAYDGGMAHGVSFGGLLRDASAWGDEVRGRARPGEQVVVSIATDGETFGHHHTFGDMGLAHVIDDLASDSSVRVENYASALERLGTAGDVRLHSPSAWSCAHGVGRWKEDCGCRAGGDETSQAWRAPLRLGLAELASRLHALFELEAASEGVGDPWVLRDRFGQVLDAPLDRRVALVVAMAPGADPVRVLELLEMEREIMASFTSCAWFFDDLAGLETLNVLRSAARALDLAGRAARGAEEGLRATLATAESNDPTRGDGSQLWDHDVRPTIRAPWRAAAVAEFRRALGAEDRQARAGAYHVTFDEASGVEIRDRRTGRLRRCTTELVHAGQGEGPGVRIVGRLDGGSLDASVTVGISDLPHPFARDVTALLRARLLSRWSRPAARAGWLTRGASASTAAVAALVHLLCEGDLRQGAVLRDAGELVAWLVSLGPNVPPEALAALAAARSRADGKLDPLLRIAGLDLDP